MAETRICPECDDKVGVTQRVVDRCGDFDVLCSDCGCAYVREGLLDQ